jgi:hypothetical protein
MTPILWPADGQQERLEQAFARKPGQASKAAPSAAPALAEGEVAAGMTPVDRDADGFVAVCAVMPLF